MAIAWARAAALAASPDAPRERALATLAAGLEAGLVGPQAWGGEYPRPVTVSRLFRHPYQVAEFPHLIVLQDDGSQLGPIGHDAPDPAQLYADSFRVILYGYVDGDDIDTPSCWLERLNFDCKRIIRRLLEPEAPLLALTPAARFLEEAVDHHEYRAAFSLPLLLLLRAPLGDTLELAP